jgi:7-cyano-7-deazaguanine tRNA-ribosyltransferase
LAVKQAIRDGRLWEYVTQKSQAHPKLREAIMNFPNYEFLETGTPMFKKKAIYFYEPLDQYRPEARRFRNMTFRFKTRKKGNLIIFPEGQIAPFYTSLAFNKLARKFPNDQICTYNPYLGIIPAEVSDIFPAAHKVVPKIKTAIYSAEDFPTFVESFTKFFQSNDFKKITIVADPFMRGIVKDYVPNDDVSVTVLDYHHDVIDSM